MTNQIDSCVVKELEHLLGYDFKNKNFLIEALTHPSLKQYNQNNNIKDYERLEFLGDAILNFIITEILFNNYANYDEGNLAKIRSYLVCRETICGVAAKLKLGNYIIMTHGEEGSGGRTNVNNIENVMEALIAAIYLDSDIGTIGKIIRKLWGSFIDVKDLSNYDPKTTLQEWAQSNSYQVPSYQLINRAGAAHISTFTVVVKIKDYKQTGVGASIKEAEKNAARKLLSDLGVLENRSSK